MDATEIEAVLANWIAHATAPPGKLATDIAPAAWAAQQFLRWWRLQVSEDLGAAEAAVSATRRELQRLGGWSNPQLAEALHELAHAADALASLRSSISLE